MAIDYWISMTQREISVLQIQKGVEAALVDIAGFRPELYCRERGQLLQEGSLLAPLTPASSLMVHAGDDWFVELTMQLDDDSDEGSERWAVVHATVMRNPGSSLLGICTAIAIARHYGTTIADDWGVMKLGTTVPAEKAVEHLRISPPAVSIEDAAARVLAKTTSRAT